MPRHISDSDFTVEWLQEIILKDTGLKANITDFSFNEVGYGRGFVSQILIINLTWDTESDSLPKSVALKIPSIKQMSKAKEQMDEKEFEKLDENLKKAFLSPELEQIQNNMVTKVNVKNTARMRGSSLRSFQLQPAGQPQSPKMLSRPTNRSTSPRHLVFEDLSDAVSTTFAAGVTFEQTMELAEQMAHLHAYSLSNDTWRNDKINITLDKLAAGTNMPEQHEMTASILPLLKADNPELFGTLCDDMLEHCKSSQDAYYIYSLNDKMGLPDVLVHGDMHCQNLVFEKSGEIKAIIDWQACHPGNIMEDMARFFCSSVSAQIRRDHWMDILRHYYSCLEKSLGSKPPYSLDQVVESYKRCLKSALLLILMLFKHIPTDETMMKGFDKVKKTRELHMNCKALMEDVMEYEAEFN